MHNSFARYLSGIIIANMEGIANDERSDEKILRESLYEPWLFSMLLERHQDEFLRITKHTLIEFYNEHIHEDFDEAARYKIALRASERVVQDAFLAMYERARDFEEVCSFYEWSQCILHEKISAHITRQIGRRGSSNTQDDVSREVTSRVESPVRLIAT